MYAHEYKLEFQVTAIIDKYHRDAIRAEQLRLARPDQPVRSFVRSLFSSARQAIVQEPVARPELVTVPSDTALIAGPDMRHLAHHQPTLHANPPLHSTRPLV